MKKTMTLLLALSLLLFSCAALAEEDAKQQLGVIDMNGVFRLQCAVPEGYSTQIMSKDNEGALVAIGPDDKTRPSAYLVVEFDEQFADVRRMNDMTDEEKQWLIDTFTKSGDVVEVTYRETAHGTQLMIVQESYGETDYISIITVYEGYMVEFDLVPSQQMTLNGQGLSEEAIQMSIDFFSELDFVPIE